MECQTIKEEQYVTLTASEVMQPKFKTERDLSLLPRLTSRAQHGLFHTPASTSDLQSICCKILTPISLLWMERERGEGKRHSSG